MSDDESQCVACHADTTNREDPTRATPGVSVIVVLAILANGRRLDRVLLDLCPVHRPVFVQAAEAVRLGMSMSNVDPTEN
jgi:hypothetical protein